MLPSSSIRWLSLAAIVFALVACQSDDALSGWELAKRVGVASHELEREEVDAEIAMLRRLRDAPHPGYGGLAVSRALRASDPGIPTPLTQMTPLGFGVESWGLPLRAGQVECKPMVLAVHDQIAELDLICSTFADHFAALEKLYARVFDKPDSGFIPGGEKAPRDRVAFLRRTYRSDKAQAAVAQALAAGLGPRLPVEAEGEVARAHAELTSWRGHKVVGFACGIGGSPTSAAKQMQVLVDAKRADLLRDVLRGPSPEGRVLGALGLVKLDAFGDEDRRSVEALLAQPIYITTCGGCHDHLGHQASFLVDLVFPPSGASPVPR